MELESGYLPLQQPGTGYNTPAGANYSAQQGPSSSYGPQQSPASGGGGSGATKATKIYNLPDPNDFKICTATRVPQVSKLPLYEKGKNLRYDQIKQQCIHNCYLAATLAAMANTNAGRKQITGMITPHKGAITTICKKHDSNSVGPKQRLKSNRWFTVSFKAKSIDVSDVLYHDDSDSNPNLFYMTTPYPDRALWGAIIEVAYAKLKGDYDNIGGNTTTINKFLDEFSAVKWTFLLPASDKTSIKKACKNAGKKAAFIATMASGTSNLIGFHGYAVLGMSGTKVKLWEPLQGTEEGIEFKDLLTEIQAVIVSS